RRASRHGVARDGDEDVASGIAGGRARGGRGRAAHECGPLQRACIVVPNDTARASQPAAAVADQEDAAGGGGLEGRLAEETADRLGGSRAVRSEGPEVQKIRRRVGGGRQAVDGEKVAAAG